MKTFILTLLIFIHLNAQAECGNGNNQITLKNKVVMSVLNDRSLLLEGYTAHFLEINEINTDEDNNCNHQSLEGALQIEHLNSGCKEVFSVKYESSMGVTSNLDYRRVARHCGPRR